MALFGFNTVDLIRCREGGNPCRALSHHMGRPGTAGTIGCAIAASAWAILLPTTYFVRVHYRIVPSHHQPKNCRAVLSECVCSSSRDELSCRHRSVLSKRTGTALFYLLGTVACGGGAVYLGGADLWHARPMATRFDPPPLQRAVTYRIYPSPTKGPIFVIGSKLIRALATTTSQLTLPGRGTAQEIPGR